MQISDIVAHVRESKAITFIIGAGASVSAGIPTAPTLVKMITEEFSHCLTDLSSDDRKDYGRVMGALTPKQRRGLIEPLLADAKLNWGHLALACIIQKFEVRRVLNFNFDFLLEQATTLLGEHLPVYDCGASPVSYIDNLADKALFHLHGQSYGVVLLNSEEETKEHVERLRPLFKDSLHNHLVIVAGYSGQADAAFSLFEGECTGNERLIWLGYDEEPTTNLAKLCFKRFFTYVGGCDFDRTMISLARGLGCWPPSLIENPPRHAWSLLSKLPSFPVGEDDSTDVVDGTKRRLDVLIDEWVRGRSKEELAADALISGNILPGAMTDAATSSAEVDLITWNCVEAGKSFAREAGSLEGEARKRALERSYASFEAALRIKPDMHEALNNWGVSLRRIADLHEGEMRLKTLEDAASKYERAVSIKPDKHGALYNWGIALSKIAELREGEARLEALEDAASKYERAVSIKPDKHEALYNWGIALRRIADLHEGEMRLKTLEDAASKYERAVSIKPDKHGALYNWGIALSKIAELREGEARLDTLEDAASKYERAVSIKPDMHEALNNWGNTLGEIADLRKGEARLETLEDAASKYERAVAIKPDKYGALLNWGIALGEIADLREGEVRLETLEDAASKLERAVAIKPDMHEALYNWGIALRRIADLREGEARLETLEDAASKYQRALAIKSEKNVALYDRSVTPDNIADLSGGKARSETLDDADSK